MRTASIVVAIVVAIGLATGLAGAGRAAFPGANGRIAYVRAGADGTQLVTVEATGRNERVLLSGLGVSTESWSPDGKRLVLAASKGDEQPPGSRIWAVSADGRGLRALTMPPEGASDLDPGWSPDGKSIVFDRRYPSPIVAGSPPAPVGPQLLVMRADGSGLRMLGPGRSPAWSPDGRSIAFVSEREVGPASLRSVWVMAADGTARRALTRTGSQDEDSPDWSPDSRRIVYTDGGRLLTIGRNGRKPAQLTAGAFPDEDPAWSPDGRRIVFVRNFLTRGAPALRLFVMPSGGGSQRLLVPGRFESFAPDWQPLRRA